jgi:hypothetical protein
VWSCWKLLLLVLTHSLHRLQAGVSSSMHCERNCKHLHSGGVMQAL